MKSEEFRGLTDFKIYCKPDNIVMESDFALYVTGGRLVVSRELEFSK